MLQKYHSGQPKEFFTNRICITPQSTEIQLKIDGSLYLIPKNARFILGDVNKTHFHNTEKFDLVYLDPPWKNKSVSRGKKYLTNSMKLLENLRLECITASEGVIAIWITNNARVREYVDEFMEKRGFSHRATWEWLKIAANGEPVVPFGNCHKMPSEKLLFFSRTFVTELCNTTFATIPTRVHSQKPAIYALLEQVAPGPTSNCIEIFARRVVSGWSAIGNEVLYLNDRDLFEPKTL